MSATESAVFVLAFAAHVRACLAGSTYNPNISRLAQHLTPKTVGGWLTAASRCGLREQVTICIDYTVKQQLSVDYDLIIGLDKADANQLLTAKQRQFCSQAAAMEPLRQKAARADACGRLFQDASKLGARQYAYKCANGHTWLMHSPHAAFCCRNVTASSAG